MSNIVETIVNNQIENSFTAQVSQLKQYEQDTLVCPGAPKLSSFESFEAPFLVDDELLAYYNRSRVTSPSLARAESLLEEDDRDSLVCPGASKIPLFEEFDGLGIVTDEPLFCHNCVSPTTSPSFESHLEAEDRDKLVCPGAPKLEYSEFVKEHYIGEPLGLLHSSTWGLDSDDDSDNTHPRALFGLFPEAEPEPSVVFRICSVPMCRDSEVTSGSTLLSTPPPPSFIEQGETDDSRYKEVEMTSDPVVVGETALVSRDEESHSPRDPNVIGF